MKTIHKRVLRRGNKGAALVSVLIGVLFISILASSLLYMATLNFQMKKMRYTSTDNFYTAEFALEEMLAQIREKCIVPDTAYNTAHANYYKELQTIFGKTTDASTGFDIYNEENLRNLIDIDCRKYGEVNAPVGSKPVIEGIAGIKVTNIYRNPDVRDSAVRDWGSYTRSVYEEDGKSIKIYGLMITVTTDEAHGSYESSVSLDLEYAFPEYQNSNYSYGVPFGVLSDSPCKINAGNHVFTGPIYMAKNNNQVNGHKFSMYVGDGAVVSLLSRSFFEGDVYVDKGTLMISDNAYINGNLIVDSPGTVMVNGNLFIRGGVIGSAASNGVKKSATGTVTLNTPNTVVNWDNIDTKYGGALAKKVAAEQIHFYIDATDGTVAGYGNKKSDLWCPMDKFQGSGYLGKNTGAKIYNSGTVDGKTVQALYLQETTLNTTSAFSTLDNTLIITHRDVQIQKPFTNSTYINISSKNTDVVEFESGLKAYTNVWGAMDRETFDAAKKLFFNSPINQVTTSNYSVKFASSGNVNQITNTNTTGIGADAFVINGSDPVERYGTEGSGAGAQYYYRNPATDEIYMPFGNLLNPNYGSLVDEFWGSCYSGGGTSTGTGTGNLDATPTLLISHWTKQ